MVLYPFYSIHIFIKITSKIYLHRSRERCEGAIERQRHGVRNQRLRLWFLVVNVYYINVGGHST